MKGIILAGGSGTRLYPLTKITSKQLIPIYDKPMIYYPLSLLMLGGIKDILIITTPTDQPSFKALLGDGSHLGIKLQFQIQLEPKGLPEAFILGENFIGNDDVVLILGDNLFYGDISFYRQAIKNQIEKKENCHARVFAYSVADPKAYGVVEFDNKTKIVKSIEEKPEFPKSSFAIPGLYLFDNTVAKRAKSLLPSKRGELEIVDLMKSYLNENTLGVQIINRGVAWLDTGTPKALLEASEFIGAIEERQGLKVACLEEVALRMNFVSVDQMKKHVDEMKKSSYKDYLIKIINELDFLQ
jgi:glucose-1-phosphate thymidylyltransferase